MNAQDLAGSRTKGDGVPPDLRPLLKTARQVKQALPPVQPSPSFQSGLDDELQRVARRLALRRGTAPVIIVEQSAAPVDGKGIGLAVAAFGLAGGLLGLAIWRRRRRR